MNKILVPTDFSDGAFNALIHAIHLARTLGTSIEVVHAYSMPPTGSNVMVDITDILRKNAEEELDNLKSKVEGLKISAGVEFSYSASHGSVVDVVNRLSEKHDIDLVVMGTQGASGITEKWLGSNTAAAARNVNKPLIAIPAEEPYKEIERILFSTDMKVIKSDSPLKTIAYLLEKTGAKIKFVHVREDENDIEKSEEAFKEQVRKVISHTNPEFTFVLDDEVEEGIEKAIENEKPDLLVVVRHEYGFFQNLLHSSVSRQMLNNASLPILVFNE